MKKYFTFVPLLLAAVGVTFYSLRQASDSVYYYADVETGDLSQWTGDRHPETGWSLGGVWISGNGHADAVTNVAHSGNYSVALTVNGHAGVRMARRGLATDPRLPDAAYYSVWFYFPQSVDVNEWWNVFQWKSEYLRTNGQGSSDPTGSVNVQSRSDGSMYFVYNAKIGADGGTYKRNVASADVDIPIGQWFQLECMYEWDKQDGRVTCWQDGYLLWDLTGFPTEFDFTGSGYRDIEHTRQWAVNNYTGGTQPSTQTIYIDDAAISPGQLGPGTTPEEPTTPAPTEEPTTPAPTEEPTEEPVPLSGLSFEAEAGNIQAPFVVSNGAVFQEVSTDGSNDLGNAGQATYAFTIETAGNYVINAMVDAPTDGRNSFYVGVDRQPTNPANIWDIDLTNGFELRTVSWRGSGTYNNNEFDPAVFSLSEGQHTLILMGREANTRIDRIALELVSVDPGSQPTEEPTEEPTQEPTAEPTQEPTEEPTQEPTEEPTQEPTEEPTTPAPTEEPTAEPTEEPDTPVNGLSFEAEAGDIQAPFTVANGSVFQEVATGGSYNMRRAGRATYTFNVDTAGNYVINAMVDASTDGSNSFYVAIDGQPINPSSIWDIDLTHSFDQRTVSWRGSGTYNDNEYDPAVFPLSEGQHTLVLMGREANTRIDRIWLEQVDGGSPPGDETPDPVPTAEPTEEPADPEPESYARYVNVGRCEAITWSGVEWAVDQQYSSGSWGHVGPDYHSRQPGYEMVVDDSGQPLSENAQYLHRCRAYGRDFGYRFDVPNGDYIVRLRFVEPVRDPGERLFDVEIEGHTALDNFDIAAEAGGTSRVVERAFTVSVTDGQLAIRFVGNRRASDRNAIVQAIAVTSVE